MLICETYNRQVDGACFRRGPDSGIPNQGRISRGAVLVERTVPKAPGTGRAVVLAPDRRPGGGRRSGAGSFSQGLSLPGLLPRRIQILHLAVLHHTQPLLQRDQVPCREARGYRRGGASRTCRYPAGGAHSVGASPFPGTSAATGAPIASRTR